MPEVSLEQILVAVRECDEVTRPRLFYEGAKSGHRRGEEHEKRAEADVPTRPRLALRDKVMLCVPEDKRARVARERRVEVEPQDALGAGERPRVQLQDREMAVGSHLQRLGVVGQLGALLGSAL
eukprot:4218950-Prymnesium_polylepis.1